MAGAARAEPPSARAPEGALLSARAPEGALRRRAALYRLRGGEAARRAEGEALLRAYAALQRLNLHDLAEREPSPTLHETPADSLAVLSRVEGALLEARELSSQFREAAALTVLTSVEQELLGTLDLPGAHAFLAELYVQIGLCAALLGEQGLAETSLTRALSLDPSRRVEAAEAPPVTLALARRIARSHDLLPLSDSPLRIAPSDATVWLDGQRVAGDALRARAGLHLLVVQAAGHSPYTSLLTLEPGRRAALRIALSPTAAEEARRALLAGDESPRRALQLAAAAGAPVLLVEAGGAGRALVRRCEVECELFGLEASGAHRPRFAGEIAAFSWLRAAPLHVDATPSLPVWGRWPVWVGSAALVTAGVVALVLLRHEGETRRQRQLEIDPGLPPP